MFHKIVIAGANGFLGKLLAEYFRHRSESVILLARRKIEASGNVSYRYWDGENIGEWIADKLPFTPSRKAPLGLSARFISGGACGLAVCLGVGPVSSVTMALCVAAGLLGAATGTFGGYEFRRRLVQATGGRDWPIALLEDALAAALLLASLYGLAHQAPVQTQVFYDVL